MYLFLKVAMQEKWVYKVWVLYIYTDQGVPTPSVKDAIGGKLKFTLAYCIK